MSLLYKQASIILHKYNKKEANLKSLCYNSSIINKVERLELMILETCVCFG